MNNEKLILNNQATILRLMTKASQEYKCRKCLGEDVSEHGLYCKEEMIQDSLDKIREVLLPKEEVPYEKSLEVCDNCGFKEEEHGNPDLKSCGVFVKSGMEGGS